MKILPVICIILFGTISYIFPQADISKKEDIAVLPSYSSYDIPDSSYQYFDDSLMGIFNKMKRFQVVGYQYRLDNNTADKFIEKVREAKKISALQNPKYVDADLGIAVIPASDMEKIANSFFVFIPSISGYNVTHYLVNVSQKPDWKVLFSFVTEYKANITVSIKIISAEGDLVDTFNTSTEAKSQAGEDDAYNKAVNQALMGLEIHLRNIDRFKIKTTVLKTEVGLVYLQLGNDIGVSPGYEFMIRKETNILDRFKENVNTGLIRVNNIGEQWSSAVIISGSPEAGDQLVEAPLIGGRVSLFAGLVPMSVQGSGFSIQFDNPDVSFKNSGFFSDSSYVFNIGLHGEYEAGYAGLLDFKVGAMISNPFAFNADLGGGYEVYIGRVSLVFGGDLSFIGLFKSLGSIDNPDGDITIGNTNFDDNIDVNLSGISIGVKPRISLDYQVSQNFKISLTAGYAYYFFNNYYLTFTSSSDSSVSSTVGLNSGDVTMRLNGNLINSLPINFNGPFGEIDFIARF
jgi:hypothetical protein